MALTLVNSENGDRVRCHGLWSEYSGDEVVYGFENTLNHQAYDLEPSPLTFMGFTDWPWPWPDDEQTIATAHKVESPWRVEV